ncbi:MAG: cytoplasmic protein [Desulfobulbus propionicus]|nr:MAG: cytoplasmic protein [Desulfobulbus propionicus]
MIFGLNRKTDEQSLLQFLQQFSTDELLEHLIPRLSTEDINTIVDILTDVMRSYLSEQEYHALFLNGPDHQQ